MKRSLRRPRLRPRSIAALLLCATVAASSAALFAASPGRAQDEDAPEIQRGDRDRRARVASPRPARSATLVLNQKRARIDAIVRKVGEAAGRTILLPDDVRGTVSIVTKRPLEIEEAWAVLESALSLLGYSLLPSPQGLWRVARVADSVGEAPFEPQTRARGESFVTTLIPLRKADVDDVMTVLEPLSGSRVTLVPYPDTNSVIASGSEVAIARLTTIANELDQIEEDALRIRVLRHRGIENVESLVERYVETGDTTLRRVEVWSDARTNSLAVRGEPAVVAQVLDFIDDVDQPIEREGNVRVLRVLNRDPEEIAELIRSLSSTSSAASGDVGEAAGPLDDADYTIAVDAPSRSLVVRARPETQAAIREVLEILDVAPQLIAVDLTVSELRMPEAYGLASGFQLPFSTGSDGNNDLTGFFRNEATSGGIDVPPTLVGQISRDTGVAVQQNVNGVPVSIPVFQTGTIAGVDFEAVNEVLIQPSLVLTAGDEHEIFVGNDVPIPVTDSAGLETGETIAGVNLPQFSRTTRFDRQEIGTRVLIEATAGEKGKIQLDLEIELSSLDLTRANLGGSPEEVGPSFTQKDLVVTARLEDGETAVLAVNNQQKERRIDSGVPFFRRLPLLGQFFRSTGSVRDEVRLIIAIRARRVSNPAELVADTIRRRLIFERRAARDSKLPQVEGPPYGVRVTTRIYEEDAIAIADALALDGHRTRVHGFRTDSTDYWDVYVTGLASMVDAGALARELSDEGWETDLVFFSKRP